jgi:putative drug exporter of the RND superfamily
MTKQTDTSGSRLSPTRLAAYATRRPRRVLAIWGIAVLASLGLTAAFINTSLTAEGTLTNNPDSLRAKALMDTRLPSENRVDEVIVVRSERAVVSDPAFKQRVSALVRDARGTGSISQIRTYYAGGGKGLVSADRHATMLPLVLAKEKHMTIIDLVPVIKHADGRAGFAVKMTGKYTLGQDFTTVSKDDLSNGELKFGLPAALIVLLLVFGTLTGAMIPMLMATMSIVVGLGITSAVGQVFQLNLFVTNMIVAMGLALGIDYSLFIVSRLREERHRGSSTEEAIMTVASTATRAVVFSGTAFTLAMIGMLLVPETTLRSLGFGAVVVGVVSIVVALTFHPAVLMLLGDRVDRTQLPWLGRRIAASAGEEGPVWRRAIVAVLRRPGTSLGLTALLLLALASPLLGLKVGSSGSSSLPATTMAKQGLVALQRDFARGATDPVNVVVDTSQTGAQTMTDIARLRTRLARDPVFSTNGATVQAGDRIAVLSVPLTAEPTTPQATAAVDRLRNDYVPAAFGAAANHVFVGGGPAEARDSFAVDRDWLPIVIVFVLGLSLVLLTVAFRSIVIPLTAIGVNLLSVGAAYGILVVVFQHGVGADIFGFGRADRIDSWVPIFLFAVLFGLSMDYQVFLLSRIRERWSATGDTNGAIVHGVSSTARLITGAAAIIIVVFSGFASGQLVSFQEMGFGIAVALALDATLVRLLLIPAAMSLLGTRNWYLPHWLEWLPRFSVEGAPPEHALPPARDEEPPIHAGTAPAPT